MWLRTGSDRSKRTLLYVEILVEASTAADGVIWRERRGFGRCRSSRFTMLATGEMSTSNLEIY
jgi:hypothetical protein